MYFASLLPENADLVGILILAKVENCWQCLCPIALVFQNMVLGPPVSGTYNKDRF